MTDLLFRIEFWVAMTFAVLIKLRASPTITKLGAVMTTLAAVTGALLFTEPVVQYLGLSGDSFKFAIAALVALTCEHVARILLNLTPAEALKLWRGK